METIIGEYELIMSYTTHQSCLRTIRHNDADFMLHDDLVMAPRAGFEISQRCPENYRSLIQECIGHGWLQPVAHVYDHELTFDRLKHG
jgi:hypothetical protein